MSVSIRARLTAWYAVLLTAVVVALGTFLVLQLRSDLRGAIDGETLTSSEAILRDMADGLDEVDAEDPLTEAGDAQEFTEAAGAVLPAGGAAQLLDGRGRVLARHGAVAGDTALVTAEERVAALAAPSGTLTKRLGSERRDHTVAVTPFASRGEPRVLVVAMSLERVEDAVERVVGLLLVAGPVTLGVTALGAYGLACQALRPVERMNADAREIGTERLHERVAVPAARDEIGRLALTLNAMLDRIERGVADQRRLVANASHELRTPLAVMRAEIDVSLRNDELSPASREVLHSALDEVDRMGRTVSNLLTLAEVEQGRLDLLTGRVALRQAIEDAARPLRALAAAKGVVLLLDGDRADAQADPHRLHLALTNLIENAIKFSPRGGRVRVSSWQRDDEVGVAVADDGPGVAPEDREHLFERFSRADSARRSRIEGSGLGLAICREVALAHGGRVWVESETGKGSTFVLALPGWRSLAPGKPGTAAGGEGAARLSGWHGSAGLPRGGTGRSMPG